MQRASSRQRWTSCFAALTCLWCGVAADIATAGAPTRQDAAPAPPPASSVAPAAATIISVQQTGELWLNTSRAGELQRSRIARAADGTYIAVRDTLAAGPAGGETSVYVRRLDTAGNPLGAETLVGQGMSPGVATFPDGTFVVTWLAPTATFSLTVPVQGQLFDRSALPVGARMALGVAGNHAQPTALADGRFVLATFGNFSRVNGPSGFVRTYTRDGAEVGTVLELHEDACGILAAPAVAALSTGGFAVAWPYACSSAPQVRMRVVDANGTPGASTRLTVGTLGETARVGLAPLTNGSLALEWAVSASSGVREVRTLVVAPSALPQSSAGATLAPLQPGRAPSGVQALASGGYVITWSATSSTEARVPVSTFSNTGALVQ
jgi:hypothetical protein